MYDIPEAFKELELEMIRLMKKNLAKHLAEKPAGEFDWKQYEVEALANLQNYRKDLKITSQPVFAKVYEEIESAIKNEYTNSLANEERLILESLTDVSRETIDATGNFSGINYDKVDALIVEINNNLKQAEISILRKNEDVYRRAIIGAQIGLESGSLTTWQAVDLFLKNEMMKGVATITYRNGAKVNLASYAEMALRTANTRASLYGQGEMRKLHGINLVQVTAHGGACPICVKWQGRVYNDDVFANFGESDPKYPNLSEAVAGGMFHPNCKNGVVTFFEGLTEKPKAPTEKEKEEQERVYRLTQQQRYNERQVRQYAKLSESCLDPGNQKFYDQKRKQAEQRHFEFLQQNSNILKRDREREKIR